MELKFGKAVQKALSRKEDMGAIEEKVRKAYLASPPPTPLVKTKLKFYDV
jgi:hypothetical protein